MSIKSITIGNFKGIRDKVKIDLKPVTLLFGQNSGGKVRLSKHFTMRGRFWFGTTLTPILQNWEAEK